ncbi:MAG: rRNA maturation RNase YbeY [Anaerovoracaceae bacterium]|jgi:probable rRNA maturation factor
MNIVIDENSNVSRKIQGFLITAAEKCVSDEGLDPSLTEISLTTVSPEEIHRLNKLYRNTDRETDVLSFPQYNDLSDVDNDEIIALGDVVICDEVAHRQAREYGHSYEREFVYLFVHSVLHLLGYDHMVEADKREMRAKEEEVMSYIGLTRGFTPAEDEPGDDAGKDGADGGEADGGETAYREADDGEAGYDEEPEEDTGYDDEKDSGTVYYVENEAAGYEERNADDAGYGEAEDRTGGYDIWKHLMELAKEASSRSYAPYSGFHVGAALLCEDGSIYTGVNIENASYGATLCAERSAVACAVSAGNREFAALAVYSPDGNASPCGICRQVLLEFGSDIDIIQKDENGSLYVTKISELLPEGFAL